VLEETRPEHISHRRGIQRQARMAAGGVLHGIDGKEAQGVDAQPVHVPGAIFGNELRAHSGSPGVLAGRLIMNRSPRLPGM